MVLSSIFMVSSERKIELRFLCEWRNETTMLHVAADVVPSWSAERVSAKLALPCEGLYTCIPTRCGQRHSSTLQLAPHRSWTYTFHTYSKSKMGTDHLNYLKQMGCGCSCSERKFSACDIPSIAIYGSKMRRKSCKYRWTFVVFQRPRIIKMIQILIYVFLDLYLQK